MRIIAGTMRSRTIVAPKGTDTRPTLDRTRESLFNIIAGDCPGARVLDLYAGSGALALESISRGAHSAVVCDCSRERTAAAISAIGKKEAEKIFAECREEGKTEEIEVCCRFCDKKYVFTPDDCKKIFG